MWSCIHLTENNRGSFSCAYVYKLLWICLGRRLYSVWHFCRGLSFGLLFALWILHVYSAKGILCMHPGSTQQTLDTHRTHRTRELEGTGPLRFHAVQFVNMEHIESEDFCSLHRLISRSLFISSCYCYRYFFSYLSLLSELTHSWIANLWDLSFWLRLDVHPICFPRLRSAGLNKPHSSNIK